MAALSVSSQFLRDLCETLFDRCMRQKAGNLRSLEVFALSSHACLDVFKLVAKDNFIACFKGYSLNIIYRPIAIEPPYEIRFNGDFLSPLFIKFITKIQFHRFYFNDDGSATKFIEFFNHHKDLTELELLSPSLIPRIILPTFENLCLQLRVLKGSAYSIHVLLKDFSFPELTQLAVTGPIDDVNLVFQEANRFPKIETLTLGNIEVFTLPEAAFISIKNLEFVVSELRLIDVVTIFSFLKQFPEVDAAKVYCNGYRDVPLVLKKKVY